MVVPRLSRKHQYSILGRRPPVLAGDQLDSVLVLYSRLVAFLVKNSVDPKKIFKISGIIIFVVLCKLLQKQFKIFFCEMYSNV